MRSEWWATRESTLTMDPQVFQTAPRIHIFDVREAILPRHVVSGMYWFRWVDVNNIERVRRAVVSDQRGRLFMQFADQHWVPCSDAADLPVDLLGSNCGFYPFTYVEGGNHV